MSDTDTFAVTFLKQKVFHNGTSMIVAKAGDKREIEAQLVSNMVADGSIKVPKGWAAAIEAKAEPAAADDAGATDAPAEEAPPA